MNLKEDQPKIHFVKKNWGWEKWIVNKDLYCGKLLYFVKSKKSSFHFHKIKDEMFYVQSGRLQIYYHDDVEEITEIIKSHSNYSDYCDSIILEPGDNFYLPPGRVHQVVALLDTELFEFSTKHEDSDSYRLIIGD